MSVTELANELVSLCKEGKNAEVFEKHYSPEIVSVEADENSPVAHGIEGIKGKMEWFQSTFEVHGAVVEGPWIHHDEFAVRFTYDVTDKKSGQRFPMDEIASYTVKDGKIVHEKFFYTSGAH